MKTKISKLFENYYKYRGIADRYGAELVQLAQPYTNYELHFEDVHGDGLCFGFDTDLDSPGWLIPIDIFFELAEKYQMIPDEVIKSSCI